MTRFLEIFALGLMGGMAISVLGQVAGVPTYAIYLTCFLYGMSLPILMGPDEEN